MRFSTGRAALLTYSADEAQRTVVGRRGIAGWGVRRARDRAARVAALVAAARRDGGASRRARLGGAGRSMGARPLRRTGARRSAHEPRGRSTAARGRFGLRGDRAVAG